MTVPFYLGLEFSLGDLIGGGTRLLASGALYIALNVGGGLLLGLALGWGGAEALVVAGVVGISSSAIVTKLLVELKRLANPETKLILGVIVVEDVFLALYLAALQPLLSDTSGWAALWSFGKAVLFLLALTAFARWGGGLVGRLLGSSDDELLTVASREASSPSSWWPWPSPPGSTPASPRSPRATCSSSPSAGPSWPKWLATAYRRVLPV